MPKKIYRSIGMGGTFDHFHRGHQEFIRFAATLADEVLIGITHPKLSQSKPLAHLIEEYWVRYNSVRTFCQKEK